MKARDLVILGVGAYAAYKVYEVYKAEKRIYDFAYNAWEATSWWTGAAWPLSPPSVFNAVAGLFNSLLTGVTSGFSDYTGGWTSSGGGGFR